MDKEELDDDSSHTCGLHMHRVLHGHHSEAARVLEWQKQAVT
jgi:hypothetical protein